MAIHKGLATTNLHVAAHTVADAAARATLAAGLVTAEDAIEQLAKDCLADMLNTALGACTAALIQEATNVEDY